MSMDHPTAEAPATDRLWAAVVDEADVRFDGRVVLTGELAVTLHGSETAGWKGIAKWVEDHWDQHVNAAVGLDAHAYREMPGDASEAVKAYFQEIGGRAVVREVTAPATDLGYVWAAVLDEADVSYGSTVTLAGELIVTLHTDQLDGWQQVRRWVEDHHTRHPAKVPDDDLDPATPADDERAATDAYLASLGSRAAVRAVRLPLPRD